MTDLRTLVTSGEAVITEEHNKEEKKKLGALRGANAGYITPEGVIAGHCPREAVLRYFGYGKEFDLSKKIMFAFGELAEEYLKSRITKSPKFADMKMLSQEETGIKWTTKQGIDVTGRPDIVLTENEVPAIGIECKMICSAYTMLNRVPFGKEAIPDTGHLVQAAHYSWQLGAKFGKEYIDWVICYVSPVDWHATAHKELRNVPAVWDQFVERREDGAVLKVIPFITIYQLRFKSGELYFKHESDTKWYKTNITISGIQQYYELTAECIQQRKMPPRMQNLDVFNNKLTWDRYSKRYNDLAHLHEAYDNGVIGFDEFLTKALEEGININNVKE